MLRIKSFTIFAYAVAGWNTTTVEQFYTEFAYKVLVMMDPVATRISNGTVLGTFLQWFHVQHIILPEGYTERCLGIVHVHAGTF